MPALPDTFDRVKLPVDKHAVLLFRKLSSIGGIIVLIGACLIFIGTLCHLAVFANIFGANILNMPSVIMLAASGGAICLYDQKRIFQRNNVDDVTIFLFIGFLLLFISVSTGITHVYPHTMLAGAASMDVKAGFIFSLVGMALVINYSNFPHRFHYSQFFLLIALSISLFDVLQSMYQFVTIDKFVLNGKHTFFGSLLFLSTVTSLVFVRPDRGFIGLFTTDTHSSKLARRSLLYFFILPPVLGFYILAGESIGISDAYGRLALLVVGVIIMAVGITWLNIKLLYVSEVERYVMRETLRENNITLETNAKELSTKIVELEKAKKHIADKLNHQQTLVDLIESYG